MKLPRAAAALFSTVLGGALAAGCGPKAGGDAGKPRTGTGPAWAFEKEFTGGPVSLVIRLDRVEASLADTVLMEEELRVEEGFEAELPEYLPEDFEGFSVSDISSRDIASAADGSAPHPAAGVAGREPSSSEPPPGQAPPRRRRRLSLEPERSGELAIAPLAVYFRKSGEKEESSFLTGEVTVHVKGIEDAGALELRPLRGIHETLPEGSGAGALPWAIGGAGALAAAGAAALLLRRRTAKAPPAIPPHELAYESLRRLVALDLIEKGEVELFFIHLSAILREYIERRFEVHAPERTTEEFLIEASRHPSLESHRARLGEFLRLSDQVKFARFRPEPASIQAAFDALKTFLQETTPHGP